MSTLKRWFDLSGQEAKLDRKVTESGSGYLALSFRDEAGLTAVVTQETVEAIRDAGWVRADERAPQLRNYGTFRDLSEISRSLAPLFGEDEVEAAIVSRDRLRQGEELEGVDRPIYVAKDHIDQSLRHLPDAVRERANALIEMAREQQARFKGASIGVTGGRIWEVGEAVSQSAEISMASAIAKVVAVRFDEDFFGKISKLSQSDDEADRDQLARDLAGVEIDEGALREFRKRALALGRTGADVERTVASSFLTDRRSVASVVLDLDRPRAEPRPLGEGFKREVHGYKFEVSADTTTLAAREYQARLEAAMGYIGTVFGLEPDDLFDANTRIRVVQGMANSSVRGLQIRSVKQGTDQNGQDYSEADGAIIFAQNTAGTALHEMCHALDRRLGDQPDKYDRILHDTGLMTRFEQMISTGQMRGVEELDNLDFVDYLKSEPEVFARLLENALREKCLADTGSLDALGGHAISGHHENYAPTDGETMEQVLRAVRSYGAERGIMPDDLSSQIGIDGAEAASKRGSRMGMGR